MADIEPSRLPQWASEVVAGAGTPSGWMQCSSGKGLDIANPTASAVDFNDMAVGLSMLCRFNGAMRSARTFYCPTPDQRILDADLRWRPAGDFKVGDEIFGFDESPVQVGAAGNPRRRFRHAHIVAVQPVRRRTYRLEMEDGSTVVSSAEHPWLVATKASGNQKWRTTQRIHDAVTAGRAPHMPRFFDVWSEDQSRLAGWLAGIFDGEGHFCFQNRGGIQLAASQRPGLTFERMRTAAESFGFRTRVCAVGSGDVLAMSIAGGWREAAKFLGVIRPHRLLAKSFEGLRAGGFTKQLEGKGAAARLRVVRSFDEGEQWVSGIETSTHTYFCEGFGAHNSVAQHSILVSWLVPEHLRAHGLLHDGHEYILGDDSTPKKNVLAALAPQAADALRDLKHRWDLAIWEAAGLKPPSAEEIVLIRQADNEALAVERRDLLAEPRDEATRKAWRWLPKPRPGVTIGTAMLPPRACEAFLWQLRDCVWGRGHRAGWA